MRTNRLIAIAGLALFGLSSQASATTILDTTNGVAFNGGAGEFIQNIPGVAPLQSLAITFSLSSPGTIQSIQAYIYQVSGSSAVFIGIMNNTGSNLPSGTFISGDALTIGPGLGPINQTSLSWSLAAGTYWLAAVATPDSSLKWQTAGGLVHDYAVGDGTGNNWNLTPGGLGDTEPMAKILGIETATTPLPAALPLFATGIGGLGLLGWRRRRKAQAV